MRIKAHQGRRSVDKSAGAGNHRLDGALARTMALCFMAVVFTPVCLTGTEIPVISGGLGPCSADFTVTDSSNKPIYNSKIRVTIFYGFMNKRKQDLEVGTNSDGKARVEGIPDKLKKKPLDYLVQFADQSKSVKQDPERNCHANFTVTLATK